jgi:glycosyltransferase domain-containing protein
METILKEKTAILIPLFGRKEFTERLLGYYNSKRSVYPIYLSDGSLKKQFTQSYLNKTYKFLKIVYLKFPYDKNYILYSKKVYETIKRIKHKYVYVLTNDDFVNLNFVKKAEFFLENNDDYTFVGGLVYNYRVIQIFKRINDFGYFLKSRLQYKGFYKNISSNKIHERVKSYLSATTLECLVRKRTLLNIWKLAYQFKANNFTEQLWFFLLIPLIEGKKKFLNMISLLRQQNTYFSEGQMSPFIKIDKNRYNIFVNFLIKKKIFFKKDYLIIKAIKNLYININTTNEDRKKKLFFYYYSKIKKLIFFTNELIFFLYFKFNNKKKYNSLYKEIDKWI